MLLWFLFRLSKEPSTENCAGMPLAVLFRLSKEPSTENYAGMLLWFLLRLSSKNLEYLPPVLDQRLF
jgi:hypothetical protein